MTLMDLQNMVNHYLNFKFPLHLLLFIQIFLIISFPIKLSFLIIYILIYISFEFFFFSEKLVNFYIYIYIYIYFLFTVLLQYTIRGLSVKVYHGVKFAITHWLEKGMHTIRRSLHKLGAQLIQLKTVLWVTDTVCLTMKWPSMSSAQKEKCV